MLRTRAVTALLLVAGLALILFAMPPQAAAVTFAGIAALAGWEWGGLMKQDKPACVMYAFVLLLFCWQLTVAAPAPWHCLHASVRTMSRVAVTVVPSGTKSNDAVAVAPAWPPIITDTRCFLPRS